MVGHEVINKTGLYAPVMHGQMVCRHVKALRERIPGCSGADVIIVPESNTAFESQNYCLGIIESQIPHVFLMDEDTKHVGVRTDNAAKKRMATMFAHALRASVVKFHPLLVTHAIKSQPADTPYTPREMMEMLVKQAGNFKRKRIKKRKRAEDDREEFTEIYSGKQGGLMDDLIMAAMICYIGNVIYRQKYEEVYRHKEPLWKP